MKKFWSKVWEATKSKRILIPVVILIVALFLAITGHIILALERKNAELENELSELISENIELDKSNIKLEARNEDLEKRNYHLEQINNDLWELYYSQVTDYDGEYEYYE